ELGGLERDGITRLDVHRDAILADAPANAPVLLYASLAARRDTRPAPARSGPPPLACSLRSPLAAHGPNDCLTFCIARGYSTRVPSRPGSGAGIWGSRRVKTSTRRVATATSRAHLWSAGTTYHGAQSVDVAVSASS